MQSGFSVERLRTEAHRRWLKPQEVLFILQNHGSYQITQGTPNQPPSGSLLLFNKRIHRFFRRDGYSWRRKRDGRAIAEAHERLKVGNVDALNCYYAHGENNPYFQRRCYWMLDPAFDHIVLVHYREVSEGRSLDGTSLSPESGTNFNQINTSSKEFISVDSEVREPYRLSYSPGSVEEVNSRPCMDSDSYLDSEGSSINSASSSQTEVSLALRKLAVQLSLDDDDEIPRVEEKFLQSADAKSQHSSILNYEKDNSVNGPLHGWEGRANNNFWLGDPIELYDPSTSFLHRSPGSNYVDKRNEPAPWNEMLELLPGSRPSTSQKTSGMLPLGGNPTSSAGYTCTFGQTAQDSNYHENDALFPSPDNGNISLYSTEQHLEKSPSQCPGFVINNADNNSNSYQLSQNDLCLSEARRFLLENDELAEIPGTTGGPEGIKEPRSLASEGHTDKMSVAANFRKDTIADSIRPMNLDVDNKLFSSFSSCLNPNQCVALPGENSVLTVADNQRFSIREVSPEWAYSCQRTKVFIIGDFLCASSDCSWAAMFGDVEVPLEIVQDGVLSCQAPSLVPGKVTLCITCRNREACSQIREFEYLAKPVTSASTPTILQPDSVNSTTELFLLMKFARFLLNGVDSVTLVKKENNELEYDSFRKQKGKNDQWEQINGTLLDGTENPLHTKDWLLQELLKDRLDQWLSFKNYKSSGMACSLSKEEQCIIHAISGLGYEWALNPILNSGVGINFRDVNGWTALHWASHFGREKMVAALLAAGASPGAVTDPTSHDPVGKTPASIAAASGYKGLAGYLSEVRLTNHLSSLTVGESEISLTSADLEADRAVKSISERTKELSACATEDQLSLKDSLAAVRNATQAAARIQSAFRAHSFRKRQLNTSVDVDQYDLTTEEIHGLAFASRQQRGFHASQDQKLHGAALCIQKKFRGWKGRKNFLTLRQHVVRIQAHVRGHQVRKKYKEIIWTVSVLEKVILRWRRRGVGLRGFRAESEQMNEVEEDDILKIFRKQKVDAALDGAVSRVLSMVEYPEARQQYRRMLDEYNHAKAVRGNAGETPSDFPKDLDIGDPEIYQQTLDDAWAKLRQ